MEISHQHSDSSWSSGKIYSLDYSMHDNSLFFCTSKWRTGRILSEQKGFKARMFFISLLICHMQGEWSFGLSQDKAI